MTRALIIGYQLHQILCWHSRCFDIGRLAIVSCPGCHRFHQRLVGIHDARVMLYMLYTKKSLQQNVQACQVPDKGGA